MNDASDDTSGGGDGREDRERAWVRGILAGSRAHLDLLYETYFTRVYWLAHERSVNQAEAEQETEAVFLTVFRDLESQMHEVASVQLAFFEAAHRELAEVSGPPGKASRRAPCDTLVTLADRRAKRATAAETPAKVASRKAIAGRNARIAFR